MTISFRKREIIRTTIRIPEQLMRDVYEFKADESLNDFICRCVEHYCGQMRRKEIDKQFEGMNSQVQP